MSALLETTCQREEVRSDIALEATCKVRHCIRSNLSKRRSKVRHCIRSNLSKRRSKVPALLETLDRSNYIIAFVNSTHYDL